MKIHMLLLNVLILMALNETNAQIFSLEGGLGAGSVLETDNTLGKGVLRLGGNYHYTENLHFGITAETGGRLLPFDTEDEIINNQTILNAADFNFEILSLQAKYHFFQFWNTKVYVALSVGGANFYRRINEDRVTERNFIIIPEIGLAIYDVNLALRYYSKGNTPTFSDGSRLLLSEKYSMILLQASYRLRFGKK